MAKKSRKVRVGFRKNRQTGKRRTDWNRAYQRDDIEDQAAVQRESVQAKGDISRRRTIVVSVSQGRDADEQPEVKQDWKDGRVLSVTGNVALVESEQGNPYVCAISRVLRTIDIGERTSVVPGDRVYFRLVQHAVSGQDIGEPQGMVEVVQPRRTALTRSYRDREQIVAANIDQVLIVSALDEPGLKPNLVDRYIVAAEVGGLRPVICLNKADLVNLAPLQPYVGLYSQLGYEVLVTSSKTGQGLDRLRSVLGKKQTALAGQSGVGKSSLLNSIQPGLNLRVANVSQSTLHGKHTTAVATLHRLDIGGYVVDTPGIRQYVLAGVAPEEVEAYFIEFRAYVPACRFPNCIHRHEAECAVKDAVQDGDIDEGRYERYLNLIASLEEARARL